MKETPKELSPHTRDTPTRGRASRAAPAGKPPARRQSRPPPPRGASRLPHHHKVVIAGNHDFCFERNPEAARPRLRHAVYLQDQALEVEGLRLYGSPWQPWFFDWAFNLQRGEPLRAKWAQIPEGTDILI